MMTDIKKLGHGWVGRHVLYPTLRDPEQGRVQAQAHYWREERDIDPPDFVIKTNEEYELIWTHANTWPSPAEVEEAIRVFDAKNGRPPTSIMGVFPATPGTFRGIDIR